MEEVKQCIQLPDQLINTPSYQDQRRNALHQYIFNYDLITQLKAQLNNIISQKDSLTQKIFKLQASLLQNIPKLIKQQNQQIIKKYQKNLKQIQQRITHHIKCIQQQQQQFYQVQQRCNIFRYKNSDQQQFQYKSKIRCPYQSLFEFTDIAQLICCTLTCTQKSAFICGSDACECKKDHKNCLIIFAQPFIQNIMKKIQLQFSNDIIEYCEGKYLIYEKMINKISQQKYIVQQWYQNIKQNINNVKDLYLYGLTKDRQTSFCTQQKVYYSLPQDQQVHQFCNCEPLIIQSSKIKEMVNEQQLEQIYDKVIQSYNTIIYQLQEGNMILQNQKINFSLNQAEGLVVSILKNDQFNSSIKDFNSNLLKITGHLVYYCKQYKFYKIDINDINQNPQFSKKFLRQKWQRQILKRFCSDIEGKSLHLNRLFEKKLQIKSNSQYQNKKFQKKPQIKQNSIQTLVSTIKQIHNLLGQKFERQMPIINFQQLKMIENIVYTLNFNPFKTKIIIQSLSNNNYFQQKIDLIKSTKQLRKINKSLYNFIDEIHILINEKKQVKQITNTCIKIPAKIRYSKQNVQYQYFPQNKIQMLINSFKHLQKYRFFPNERKYYQQKLQRQYFQEYKINMIQFTSYELVFLVRNLQKYKINMLKEADWNTFWDIFYTNNKQKALKMFNIKQNQVKQRSKNQNQQSGFVLLAGLFDQFYQTQDYYQNQLKSQFMKKIKRKYDNQIQKIIKKRKIEQLTLNYNFSIETKFVKTLKYLKLSNIRISKNKMFLFQNNPFLQFLSLQSCWLLDGCSIEIIQKKCPNILHLCLNDVSCQIKDKSIFQSLWKFKKLKTLQFKFHHLQYFYQNFKTQYFNGIQNLKNLQLLDLDFPYKKKWLYNLKAKPIIFKASLISDLTKITFLKISDDLVQSNEFRKLKLLVNLKTLICGGLNYLDGSDIAYLTTYCKKINKLDVQRLSGSKNLIFLNSFKNFKYEKIPVGKIESKDLMIIDENIKLTHLNISYCDYIEPKYIVNLKNIQVLIISSSKFYDQIKNKLVQRGIRVFINRQIYYDKL